MDEVRLARALRDQACPGCHQTWTCGQDVHEHPPVILENGEAACQSCLRSLEGLEPRGSLFQRHLELCLSREEELSLQDREFLAKIATLDDEDLQEADCLKLLSLAQTLEGP